jgi:hypothetical protein
MMILTRSKVDEGGGKKYFKTGQKGIPRDSDEIIIYHHLPRTVIVEKYKYSK